MAKTIDKIVQQKTTPKDKNVLWDDGENLKINRKGKWENANNTETNNLSIDPIVWKYICNPFKLNNKEFIPDELIEEVVNDEGMKYATFKYQNIAMYKMFRFDTDNNEIPVEIKEFINNGSSIVSYPFDDSFEYVFGTVIITNSDTPNKKYKYEFIMDA